MRVLLVSANTERIKMTSLPLGLGMVAMAVRQAGHETAFLDLLSEADPIPYQPRLIILRAGGNDIQAGKTPEQVCGDFQAFVEKVRAKLPKVRIAYMTINATPARWANVEREKKANQLIKDYNRSRNDH